MKNTLGLCVGLAAALLWCPKADAYNLLASENSFSGTNSTTAPFVQWSRHREGNGLATIEILSHGLEGEVHGSLSLQRANAGPVSVGSESYRFNAVIEENVKPVAATPAFSIVRLTMTVECSANAFRTPPPFGNTGNAFVNLDVRLGPRMIGGSHLDFLGNWKATTNLDSGAVESSFVVAGGLIKKVRYAYRRGSGSDPSYYCQVQVNGEAIAGEFNNAQAIARATARVKLMMEVSTDNGASYSVVAWKPVNTSFLNGVRPQLTLGLLQQTNYLGVVAQPLSQHQLQAAPTLVGPWTNVGPQFVAPNLDPVVVIDAEPPETRFYRTITP